MSEGEGASDLTYRTPQGVVIRPVPLPTAESWEGHYFKCALLGEPGMGKTTCATLSLPADFYPAAVLDVDNKAASYPALLPLRREGKLDIFQIDAPLIPDFESLRGRVDDIRSILETAPKGMLQVADVINVILRGRKHQTLIFDSWSRFCEHIERTVEFLQKVHTIGTSPGEGKGVGADWLKFKTLQQDLLHFIAVTAKMNVIVTCHVQVRHVKVGQTEKTEYRPQIDGAMRDLFVSYFNEAYFLRTRVQMGGEVLHYMETQATTKVPARTSIGGMPREIQQNLRGVVGLWRKQMLGISLEEAAEQQQQKEEGGKKDES